MKIMDAFNKASPGLWRGARRGFLHGVICPVGGARGATVLSSVYKTAAEAQEAVDTLRGFGLHPVRLELKASDTPRTCLKGYYVPPVKGYGSFP